MYERGFLSVILSNVCMVELWNTHYRTHGLEINIFLDPQCYSGGNYLLPTFFPWIYATAFVLTSTDQSNFRPDITTFFHC